MQKRFRSIDKMYHFEIPIDKELSLSRQGLSKPRKDKRLSQEKMSAWMQGNSSNRLKSLFCSRGGNLKKRNKIALKSLQCKQAYFHSNIKINKNFRVRNGLNGVGDNQKLLKLTKKRNISKEIKSYRKSLTKLDKYKEVGDYQSLEKSSEIFPNTSCSNYLSRYEMKWMERAQNTIDRIEFGDISYGLKQRIPPSSSIRTTSNFYPKKKKQEIDQNRSLTFWDKELTSKRKVQQQAPDHKIRFNLKVPILKSDRQEVTKEANEIPHSKPVEYNFVGKKRYL